MQATSGDPSLSFALELEQRDEEVAERLATLAALNQGVDEVRGRADAVAAFRERLPADRAHLETAMAEAERELTEAREALARAHDAVERARSEDARTTARRHEAHAASDLHTTEERRDRLLARGKSIARESVEAESEAAELATKAAELAAALETAPRVASPVPPQAGLDGVLDWAARAHAALFVARSGLETERERVVREANELAASVLGEPLYATSVATVRRRLEERLG
ncbi:MAG TPA: hypothetical protein VNI55_02190 [Gaiellaceae bacterium]|nr:hypothetical protein [Gaiellaceae bacterium]